MSKRKPTPATDATLDALKAAKVDADIVASNLFSDAIDAAKRCGAIRNRIAEAKDAGLTDLTTLEGELAVAWAAALKATEAWMPAQKAANLVGEQVDARIAALGSEAR